METQRVMSASDVIATIRAEVQNQERVRGKFVVTGTADLNVDVPQLLSVHDKMYVKFSK